MNFSLKLYIFNFFTIIFAIFFIFSFFYFYPESKTKVTASNQPQNIESEAKKLEEIPNPSPIPTLIPSPIPVLITIPKIQINTSIVPVGNIENSNQIDIPTDGNLVGWYQNMSTPGASGSAILTAHYDLPGGAPAIFYPIKHLNPGDEIQIINNQNQKLYFSVSEVVNQSIETFPSDKIYNDNANGQLTLITCSGYWIPSKQIYSNRLAIIANLQKIETLSSFELIALDSPKELETFLIFPSMETSHNISSNLTPPYLRLSQEKNQISLYLATGSQEINAIDTKIIFDPQTISIIKDSLVFNPIFKVHHQIIETDSLRLSLFNNYQNINTQTKEIKIAEFSIIRNSNQNLQINLEDPQIIKLDPNQDFDNINNIINSYQGLTLN